MLSQIKDCCDMPNIKFGTQYMNCVFFGLYGKGRFYMQKIPSPVKFYVPFICAEFIRNFNERELSQTCPVRQS